MTRVESWLTVIALLVILGLLGSIERADASVASVFDARAEHQLGCWPWYGSALPAGALVVAHKSLPCGTKVRVCYRARCVIARVRDRGPYIAGRTWDLDRLVQQRLRMPFGVYPVRAAVIR